MSHLNELSKQELIQMVEGLELQLRDLYLEKRLSGLDRDQLVEMIGRLEERHDEVVGSLSDQLADLYSVKAESGKAEIASDHDLLKLKVAR